MKIDVEAVNRDLSSLSKTQRLKLLTLDAPELLAVASGAIKNELVSKLQHIVIPLRTFLATNEVKHNYASNQYPAGFACTDLLHERERSFVEYVRVKEQLISSYLINLLFLMSLQAQSFQARSHPVMKQLLEFQYAFQKMTVLDKKFDKDAKALLEIYNNANSRKSAKNKYSYENAIQVAREDIVDTFSCYRSESANEHESSSENSDNGASIDDVSENTDSGDDYEAYVRNDEAAMNGGRNKNRKTQPDGSSGDSENDDIMDLGEYSEKTLSDISLVKAQRKAKKQALKKSLEAFGGVYRNDVESRRKSGIDDMLPTAESKAEKKLNVFTRNEEEDSDDASQKKRKSKFDDSADDFNPAAMAKLRDVLTSLYKPDETTSSRKRRPIPDTIDEGEAQLSEGDDQEALQIYEAFDSKKKAFLEKKREHYKPEARYGSMFDMEAADIAKGFKNKGKQSSTKEPDGAVKRAATYEMMKNKGLTPHRKKENRNPRVKKRMAYDKALVARRGQVREVNSSGVNTVSSYAGETTGIKSNISKARKIST